MPCVKPFLTRRALSAENVRHFGQMLKTVGRHDKIYIDSGLREQMKAPLSVCRGITSPCGERKNGKFFDGELRNSNDCATISRSAASMEEL